MFFNEIFISKLSINKKKDDSLSFNLIMILFFIRLIIDAFVMILLANKQYFIKKIII